MELTVHIESEPN